MLFVSVELVAGAEAEVKQITQILISSCLLTVNWVIFAVDLLAKKLMSSQMNDIANQEENHKIT